MLRALPLAVSAVVVAQIATACRAARQTPADSVADSAAHRMADSGAVRDVIGRPGGSDTARGRTPPGSARGPREPRLSDFKRPERRPAVYDSMRRA